MDRWVSVEVEHSIPGSVSKLVRWPSKAVADTANRPQTALEGHLH